MQFASYIEEGLTLELLQTRIITNMCHSRDGSQRNLFIEWSTKGAILPSPIQALLLSQNMMSGTIIDRIRSFHAGLNSRLVENVHASSWLLTLPQSDF